MATNEFTMSEEERNLYAMAAPSMVFIVDRNRVNIDDLLESYRPGAIVRCDGPPDDCIRIVNYDNTLLGCVAGWISDGD